MRLELGCGEALQGKVTADSCERCWKYRRERMRPDGTRESEPTEDYVFSLWKRLCEIQVGTERHISNYSCRVWWLLNDV